MNLPRQRVIAFCVMFPRSPQHGLSTVEALTWLSIALGTGFVFTILGKSIANRFHEDPVGEVAQVGGNPGGDLPAKPPLPPAPEAKDPAADGWIGGPFVPGVKMPLSTAQLLESSLEKFMKDGVLTDAERKTLAMIIARVDPGGDAARVQALVNTPYEQWTTAQKIYYQGLMVLSGTVYGIVDGTLLGLLDAAVEAGDRVVPQGQSAFKVGQTIVSVKNIYESFVSTKDIALDLASGKVDIVSALGVIFRDQLAIALETRGVAGNVGSVINNAKGTPPPN
jgi:hypothetical protein